MSKEWFVDIPAEIRAKVYEAYFAGSNLDLRRTTKNLIALRMYNQLCLVSQQMKAEIKDSFRRSCMVHLPTSRAQFVLHEHNLSEFDFDTFSVPDNISLDLLRYLSTHFSHRQTKIRYLLATMPFGFGYGDPQHTKDRVKAFLELSMRHASKVVFQVTPPNDPHYRNASEVAINEKREITISALRKTQIVDGARTVVECYNWKKEQVFKIIQLFPKSTPVRYFTPKEIKAGW